MSGHAIRRAALETPQLGSAQSLPGAPASLGCPAPGAAPPPALSQLIPGLGGGPGIAQLRAAALGRALPGRARRANSGRAGGSCPARWPCGRGARALRLHGRANPPLGCKLAAVDPCASGLRARRRGSGPAVGEALEDPPPRGAGFPGLGDGAKGGTHRSRDAPRRDTPERPAVPSVRPLSFPAPTGKAAPGAARRRAGRAGAQREPLHFLRVGEGRASKLRPREQRGARGPMGSRAGGGASRLQLKETCCGSSAGTELRRRQRQREARGRAAAAAAAAGTQVGLQLGDFGSQSGRGAAEQQPRGSRCAPLRARPRCWT